MVKNLPSNSGDAGDMGLIAGSDPWIGKILWRREWLSTSVFLPGKSRGQRSLVGYHGVAESDMTEQLTLFKSLSLGQFITQS